MTSRWFQWLVVCCLALAFAGCVTVQPWQREELAKPIMQVASDENERALELVQDKAQYEGTMGGGTSEGSGCGCN